ncbi:hypothetical protein ACMX25_31975 [Caballeronia sp. 15715]|uniref:hypothetical protein n=1 Tax=Caballeronia sp. 15715 TaxID=3391030 RepID=UPI0039E2CEFA
MGTKIQIRSNPKSENPVNPCDDGVFCFLRVEALLFESELEIALRNVETALERRPS